MGRTPTQLFAFPFFFAPDEGGGDALAEAASPGTFDDAASAMEARLDATFGEERNLENIPIQQGAAGTETPAGGPAGEPSAEEREVDPFSDEAVDALVPDNMPYRDAKKLREQVTKLRDTYRPLHDALRALDDNERQSVLEAVPQLGQDFVNAARFLTSVHPQDRQFFLESFQMMQTDPVHAAERLAWASEVYRANARGEEPPPPPWVQQQAQQDTQDDDIDGDEYLTRAEFEELLRQQEAEREFAQRQAEQKQQIIQKLNELGYDWQKAEEGNDPIEQARIAALLEIARREDHGGDLEKAHATLNGWQQSIIDNFVQTKSANADRPPALTNVGAAATQERKLETLEDAEAAVEARLDAIYGPDPRGR